MPITVDILDNDDKVQNIEQQLSAEIEEIKKKMAKEIHNLRMALEESKLKACIHCKSFWNLFLELQYKAIG